MQKLFIVIINRQRQKAFISQDDQKGNKYASMCHISESNLNNNSNCPHRVNLSI